MAGRSNNRPILTACVAAGLAVSLAGCGGVRTGFLAPPRLPADAPPMQSVASLSATAPNDAGIPALGSGSAYSAQMTPSAMPGVDAILARLEELDSRITGLQKQFQAAEPAISRLIRIDGDIRALLAQMEGAVAARSEEAPVAKAVTSRPGALSGAPSGTPPAGRPDRSAETTLTMATPIRPSTPLGVPLTAPPSGPPSGLPSVPLVDPGSLRLSLSPTPALPQPQAQPQQPAQQPATQQPPAPTALTAAVHLASYRNVENARDGWRILQRRYPNQLGTLVPMVLEVDLGSGRGRMLRLQASALTPGEARALCEQLKQAGQYCLPTADTGRPMTHAGLQPANALYIK
jgi:hypothetical protein